MPVFRCERCGYATRKRDHFMNHLARKKPCTSSPADKRVFELVEKRLNLLLEGFLERLQRLELTTKRLLFRLDHFEPDR